MTDLDIAKKACIKPISNIAATMGISTETIEMYGRYKAKLPLKLINEKKIENSNLILVSAISPTPAGEGKTTVSIGLSQALNKIDKKSIVVLREPSLGPVFGMKGGAAGGGYSQVIPMLDINLHFTGDFAAIESANNLLAAIIDNNIQNKTNNLGIDPRTIQVKRVLDVNDRSLRDVVIGLGGSANGIPRESGFDITAASEVMAILCMSRNIKELKENLGNIFVGYTFDKKPVYARDLKAEGAMAVLLRDAIKPNLVQTLENTPAIIHGGPFANIAQGTNTIIATKMGMSYCDYTVTEAGFGFDLGGEKFLDIKCPKLGKYPKVVVLVATLKSIKYHGGVNLKEVAEPNLEALKKGITNLEKHIKNAKSFGLTPIIAINKFSKDTTEELEWLERYCNELGVEVSLCEVWEKGGKGGIDLAEKVVKAIEESKATEINHPYNTEDKIECKIKDLCTKIYGAGEFEYTSKARADIKKIEDLGLSSLPICIAKTQKSFSQDEGKLGFPEGHSMTIREIEIASGAGFIIPIMGNMMRMPGLPTHPASENIDIDENCHAVGIF